MGYESAKSEAAEETKHNAIMEHVSLNVQIDSLKSNIEALKGKLGPILREVDSAEAIPSFEALRESDASSLRSFIAQSRHEIEKIRDDLRALISRIDL